MSESTSNEPESESSAEEQSVDLSALASFSFGTQWTAVDKPSKGGQRSGGGRRDGGDRRRGQSGAAGRKDRRPPRPANAGGGGGEGQRRPDRRDNQQRGHERGQRREGGGNFRRSAPEVPYESAIFDVAFYPEDNGFSAIIKAMRSNHLTYELFEVSRTFLVKFDRLIASVTRKPEKEGEKAPKVFISMADNMPFATEEEALMHAATNNIGEYFDMEEVEVEAPSGSFAFVNRCPFTKTLLGPPNYHRYEETLKNHHRTKLPNMSFEKLQSSIETVREEEAVNEWLESMKKATRYTTKAVEGEEPKTFDTFEDALLYLKTEQRAKLVKAVNYARVNGSVVEKYKNTEAFRAVEGELKRQRKFPLETANAIRGRMRREKFSIYKKGSKGVTYVCATKRNFRTPGQVMSPSLDRIIRFIEANQNIRAKEFLAPYQEWLKENEPDLVYDEKQAQADLHWLIADGYVSHFGDDRLFCQPIMDNAPKPKKKEAPAPKAPAESKKVETEAKSAESAPAAAVKDEPVSEEAPPVVEKESTPEATVEEASSEPVVEKPVEEPVAETVAQEKAPEEAVAEAVAAEESPVESKADSVVEEATAEEPVAEKAAEEEPPEAPVDEPEAKKAPAEEAPAPEAVDEGDSTSEKPEEKEQKTAT